MSDAKVTAASEWKIAREVGITRTLPSGKTVRLRPVGFDMIVKLGKIPDSLGAVISEAVFSNQAVVPNFETLQGTKDLVLLLDALTELAFIEPVARPNGVAPGDNEISVDDVELGDKFALLNLLGLPARELESFRIEPPLPVGGVDAAKVNGAAGVGNPGRAGMGVGDDRDAGLVDSLPVR